VVCGGNNRRISPRKEARARGVRDREREGGREGEAGRRRRDPYRRRRVRRGRGRRSDGRG
jgi:hypothetical protein